MAKILVIEDDPLGLEALELALHEYGHEVRTAIEGGAGLKLIKRERFDLVITDLIMPGKEGLETLREIRQHHGALKVIAISGGGQLPPIPYLKMAKTFGANDVLQKPFSSSDLAARVDHVLSQ